MRKLFSLTASEVAGAIGIGYKSPFMTWKQKTGQAPEDNLESNPFVQHGIENEDVARFEFQCFMALDLPDYTLEQPGITVYRNDTRFAASLDNLATSPDGRHRVVVEYKCPRQLYGTVPHHYMIQIQLQMEFAEAEQAYFWCWSMDQSEYFVVDRNREFLNKWLYPKMLEFTNKLDNKQFFQPQRMPAGLKEKLKLELEGYFPEIY